MGLDTYAVRILKNGKSRALTKKDHLKFKDVGSLIGGIFSGHGNQGSFRGKCYSELIETITGESLYQEIIQPQIVAEMYSKLKNAYYGKSWKSEDIEDEMKAWNMKLKDFKALVDFFEVCYINGFGLAGWW